MTGGSRPTRLSAGEIAEEIARTRSRLSRSLATLDREYALRHLFVRGLRMSQEGQRGAAPLAQAARRNILPLALIAAGLAPLALPRNGEGTALLQRLSDGMALLKQLALQLGLLDGKEMGAVGAAAAPSPPPESQPEG